MGVDGIKPKVAANVGATREATRAEAPATEAPGEPAAKPAGEGFDLKKKKLMSVSGQFRAHKPAFAERPDLKDLISAQRSAVHANAGGATAQVAKGAVGEASEGPTEKDGNFDTAAARGKDPAPRDSSLDFEAQARAALPKGSPAEIEAAAAKLAKDKVEGEFKVKVKNGDKPWTAEELTRAYESFKSMPAADQANLTGLDLIRNSKASAKSQAEMGSKGTVAGEYMPNVTNTNGKRDAPAAIAVYDAAFPKGADSRKASIHVITHEAGHAVEGRKRDEALSNYNGAVENSNAASDKLNPKIEASNDQWGAKDKKTHKYPAGSTNGAMTDFGSVSGADKPGMAFLKAQSGVQTAVVKLQNATTPADIATAQTALDAAKTKRDAALKGMTGHKKESAASDWAAATDKQEKAARAQAEANAVYVPLKAETDAKMKELKAAATVKTETGDDGKPTIVTSSNELNAFNKARGKEKAVSGYGDSKKTEEFAEAYALYQRDPKEMKTSFPNQYKYFHDHHKSPND